MKICYSERSKAQATTTMGIAEAGNNGLVAGEVLNRIGTAIVKIRNDSNRKLKLTELLSSSSILLRVGIVAASELALLTARMLW